MPSRSTREGQAIDPRKLTNWYDFMARFYAFWRDDYDIPTLDRVASILREQVRPGFILDAGCGTGLFTVGLARASPDWRIEGLDASTGMLAVAQKKASRLGLENASFRHGDVTRLPHDAATFDAVVAVGLFVNLNESPPALTEFRRVLRPGGHLLVVEFDRQKMALPTRVFFRVMISGYKLFSLFVPKFRFADRWNLETTTVDRSELKRDLASAGFESQAELQLEDQMILHYRAG